MVHRFYIIHKMACTYDMKVDAESGEQEGLTGKGGMGKIGEYIYIYMKNIHM